METLPFTEGANLYNDANKPRTSRLLLWIVAPLVIIVLLLLPCLVACFLFHHKQPTTSCWVHGHSPDLSQDQIRSWKWIRNCSESGMNTSDSSLEILESGIYFAYIYVSCNDVQTGEYFTVELVTDSNDILSVLKGPNTTRAFVNLGRPYFLEKGKKLKLRMNAGPNGLKHIDAKRTYWGLFRI